MTIADAAGYAGLSLKKKPSSPRTLFSSVMSVVATLCAVLAVIPLVAVLYYIIVRGLQYLSLDLFRQLPPPPLGDIGGFGNAFVGTLLTVGIASVISIPFGILTAIFLAEFAKDTNAPEENWIDFAVNILAGVPSIVMGTFAWATVVLLTGTFSAVAGGIALSVLMLPTIVRTATEALEAVPGTYRQASVGLGASKIDTVMKIVLPAAVPAITTGVMLAVARAVGETAPVLFTALFSQFWNRTIWEPTATLSALVYNFAQVPYPNQQNLAWAAALVLVTLVLFLNILARFITRKRG